MSGTTRSGGKVTVGCKLPNGLVITLEREVDGVGADGARFKRHVAVGDPVTLNGANTSQVIGGYGLTENVDETLFAEWLKTHAEYEPVKQGLIFAQPTMARAGDQAKERAKVKSGFEPMDPDKPGPKLEKVTD